MMRRKFALSLILITCLLALTGCHGSEKKESFEMPEKFDESRDYEVVFWAKNDTNKTQTEIYEKAISDFEALYPNIKVNMRLYTDYNKIYNDVITNISTDTTPNVCITYPDHITTYNNGNLNVIPLDSLIVNSEYGLGGNQLKFDSPTKDEIVPSFLEELRLGENLYGLPYMRSTEAVYINEDLVNKLGYEVPDILTWDFIWEVSEKAMETDADGTYLVNGQKVMIPFIYKATDNMMISMLKQRDAGYSNEEGDILIFNDTTREILTEVSKHGATKAFSTFKISSYPGNFLNAGQCIFAVDSTAGATWMGADAPLSDICDDDIVRFNTVVRMIPQYDVSNPYMMSQGPSICVFNKEDKQEVMAAWLFAQYLLTNEVQIAYSQTEGYVPVTLKAQQSDEYKDYLSRSGEDNNLYYSVKIDAAKLLLENAEHTFITPAFNGSTSLRNAAGQMIEEVTKSVRRKATVDDKYLDTLLDDMTSLYRLDQIGGGGNLSFASLPAASKALIIILVITWLVLAAIVVISKLRKRNA